MPITSRPSLGRKTDVKDCEWLADLLAHGLIRANFIPPAPIRALRDLARHRKGLIRDRVKAANRVHKLLEDGNIKWGNIVSDVLGVSGRAMLDALVPGDTDPARLATLARGSLTPKKKQLAEALCGRFTAHHGFLLGQILTQLDQLAALVASCDARITDAHPTAQARPVGTHLGERRLVSKYQMPGNISGPSKS